MRTHTPVPDLGRIIRFLSLSKQKTLQISNHAFGAIDAALWLA